MATSLELREERARLVSQARKILDTAEGEERSDLSEQEQAEWQKLMTQADALKTQIDTQERKEYQAQVESDLKTSTRRTAATKPADHHNFDRYQRDALKAWFLAERGNISADLMNAAAHCGINLASRSLTLKLPTREQRALSVGTAGAGGYTVAPQFYDTLLQDLKSWGGMMQAAQIIQTATGADMPFTVAADDNVGIIVPELGQVPEQDPTFSTLNLKAYKYSSKSVKVSLELLQDSAFDLEGWLAKILGERIGKILNKHFTTGTGTGEPQGIVTGAASGGTGDVEYDAFVDLAATVDPAYQSNAKWMFAPSALATLMKLKDTTGAPLWVADLTASSPGRVLGYPFILNTDLPEGTVLFGDFKSAYVIREVMEIELFRQDEKYIDQGAIGFLAFARYGGGTINPNAVKKLVAA